MSFFQSPLGVQSATVVDNKDPDQMGRVKVNFPWDENSIQSAWANVVQPMARNTYGIYFLPEVGDTVLVGFLNNNHDYPVVLGSLYTGQGKQADCYDADNYIKDIKTKGGNLVRFYDKQGEEEIKITNTENGNEIILNMKEKKITISSPSKIELNAPGIFLNSSAIKLTGGDITIAATKQYTDKTGSNWVSDGNLKLSAENDLAADITGNDNILAQNAMNLGSNAKVSLSGKTAVDISATIGGITVNAATTADLKANAQMTVESSGITTIKGTMVMSN